MFDCIPLTSTTLPKTLRQYKQFLSDLQSKTSRVYFVKYSKKGAVGRFVVLQGDYGALTRLRYENKTEARRDIQRRMRDIEVDMRTVTTIQEQIHDSEYYRTTLGNARNITNTQHEKLITKMKSHYDKLNDALLRPNITYRAYPMFGKKN